VFQFDNLKPGTYHVRQILERGYATGPAGTRWTETLISGQAIDAAFANYQPVSVRGTVFGDSDGDALQDENERGLPGRIVVLEQVSDSETSAAIKAVAVTNVRGVYQFENLPPGTYRVRLFRIRNASTPDTHELALVSSRSLQGIDFGFLNTGRDRPAN
jgi:uncharacterized protein (DUF2141 family)